MPAKTGKQYRAMQAAAHGNSTLGIPQSVGKEFVQETPKEKRSEFSKKDEPDKTKRFMQRMREMREYKKRDPKRLYELVKKRNDRPKG
jgi:hypothetical protein